MFGCISPVVLEKIFLKCCQRIFAILFSFPLGKGWGPSFEETWIHFIQDCFVPSLVEIRLWFWRTRFLSFVHEFPLFPYHFPLEKKTFTKGCFVPSSVEIGHWFWRKDGQIVIRKAHLSLWLMWAKKKYGQVHYLWWKWIKKHSLNTLDLCQAFLYSWIK